LKVRDFTCFRLSDRDFLQGTVDGWTSKILVYEDTRVQRHVVNTPSAKPASAGAEITNHRGIRTPFPTGNGHTVNASAVKANSIDGGN